MVSTEFIVHLQKKTQGFDAITTYVDGLSRRARFISSRASGTEETVANALFRKIIPHHGLPDSLISDRDPKFTSRFWKELMSLCGVKLKMSSPPHPQTNGSSEVMNRVVENCIR